jgi:hypothetical protein
VRQLGILDDETWAYMNQHWPHVIKFRPKVCAPHSRNMRNEAPRNVS